MKVTFKDFKLNFAADICGEGQGEANIHLGEISLEASPSEITSQTRELVNLVRDVMREARKEAREQRDDDRDARRSHERVESIRARRWARRDNE